MSATELGEYLHKMEKNGTWGDGIVLSAAVRLYARPVEITSPDGCVSSIGIDKPSPLAEPILLGLIGDHYVGIQKSDVDDGDTAARAGKRLIQGLGVRTSTSTSTNTSASSISTSTSATSTSTTSTSTSASSTSTSTSTSSTSTSTSTSATSISTSTSASASASASASSTSTITSLVLVVD